MTRPTPPPPWRRFRSAFSVIAAVLLALATWSLFFTASPPFKPTGAATILIGLAVACLLSYLYARERIVIRFLRPHRGFICLRCHYPLRDLPDNGACPECGATYSRTDLITRWVKYYFVTSSQYVKWLARPDTADHPASQPASRPPQLPAVSWTGVSLNAALAHVEAVARRHGFSAPRFPFYREQLHGVIDQLKPFPSVLDAFYCWFDPSRWSHFINPDQAFTSDLGNVILHTGEPIVAGHPADGPADLIRIFPPSQLKVTTLADAVPDAAFIGGFTDCFDVHKRPEAWRNTRIIIFGNTRYGEPLVYCIDPPEGRPGCIITFITENDRVWLADSLADWLSRLAACNGVEYAFVPDNLKELDAQLAQPFLESFRAHNPLSALFGPRFDPPPPAPEDLVSPV